MCCEIGYDRAVEQCLLHSMYGWVIREAGVKPRLALAAQGTRSDRVVSSLWIDSINIRDTLTRPRPSRQHP